MKTYLAIVSLLVGATSFITYVYLNVFPLQMKGKKIVDMKIFNAEDLKKYSGIGVKSNGKEKLETPLYLAILGKVFDVTAGRSFYGEGGGYDFFTGIDGTRAFVSGNFTKEGLIDDIDDFDDEQLLGIKQWVEFYESKSDGKYFLVGYLIGRYYDSKGKPTKILRDILKRLETAELRKEMKKKYEKIVPSCNSHWQQGKGTLYSCDDPDRSPREEFFFGQSNSRCACIRMNEPGEGQEMLKKEKVTLHLYSGCQPTASTCLVSDTS